MKYPRVLVVVLGRINASDKFNNGLLLRNLFAQWPRDNIAQIFSSGDNGDAGFFGRYYQLGPRDRRLGNLFYHLKEKTWDEIISPRYVNQYKVSHFPSLRSLGKKLLMDTGLYELVFRPRVSREMINWVKEFRPDFIFAQGYNLTFTWLPLMLSRLFGIPIIYYPTDDWSSDLYCGNSNCFPLINIAIRFIVKKSVQEMIARARLCIAFNTLMQKEYQLRYKRDFFVLMHGDDWERYARTQPRRLVAPGGYWIVTTGVFDKHRLPLLFDLNRACEMIRAKGILVYATVFAVNRIAKLEISDIDSGSPSCVNIENAPSHDDLVAFLRGADILFLPERFDETANNIRLCISSKAHLFMFAQKPIVVYSAPQTGIVHYAREGRWAAVVDKRDPKFLADTFMKLLFDEKERFTLIKNAKVIADRNHNLLMIQARFLELVQSLNRNQD
jgi:glycosyltransferase involved in cell wall biosynthesis